MISDRRLYRRGVAPRDHEVTVKITARQYEELQAHLKGSGRGVDHSVRKYVAELIEADLVIRRRTPVMQGEYGWDRCRDDVSEVYD